jgi:hypothetical protein
MEPIFDLLKITVPAGIVLYAMYLTVKSFMNRQFRETLTNLQLENSKTTLPLRLQAYERMAIFLERITPNNLITRLNESSLNVAQFQHLLINEIKQEFYHNLSQQIYMSDEAWSMVRQAMEDIISMINTAARELKPEAPSLELARKLFEMVLAQENDRISEALRFVKNEIRTMF